MAHVFFTSLMAPTELSEDIDLNTVTLEYACSDFYIYDYLQ